MKKLLSEFIGTFTLVLFGCGSAIFAGESIGFAGISFAFGLSVVVMAYAVGPVSGGHFNPAVTIGLATAKRFECKWVVPYILFQVLGACAAAGVIYKIMMGADSFLGAGNFAANTIENYSVCAGFLAEAVLTFIFLVVIINVTSKENSGCYAALAIGLTLVCIHLVSIPITNTSVNPARSTSQVLFSENSLALDQLWIFWAAPILGGFVAGILHRFGCCGCCGGDCKKEEKKAVKAPAKKK